MPEWLLKTEQYSPKADQDTFVNKSILALLYAIAKIKTQSGKKDGYTINAVFKIAFTLLLIILLSLSRSFPFVLIVNVYLLVIISLMPARDIIKILKMSFIIAVFSFLILLPSAIRGNSYSVIMITSKIAATVAAVNLLSHSAKWNSITAALKRFFVPDIFILVLDITMKYIVMLGDFTLNMLYALKLRSVGKNTRKYTSLSGIAGTMFLKSKEMAEDMYAAMECRGFTGDYHRVEKMKFTFADFIYILIQVAILFIFMYFERI